MKPVRCVLLLTALVCGVNSLNPSVNAVKPFEDLDHRDVRDTKSHVYSYQQPVSCSGFSNMLHCFKLELMQNVTDILDGDDFRLTDSLVIEKLPPSKLNSVDDSANHGLKLRLKKYLMSGKESNRMILEGAMGILRSHSLRWTPLPGVNVRMFRNPEFGGKMDMAVELEDNTQKGSPLAPRTFFRRKMQFALLSVMYKMGVITTLLGALVVISLKTLTVGVILLFLTGFNTVKTLADKLHKFGLGHGHHASYHEFRTPEILETGPAAVPHKEVHVHIHNSGAGHGYISGSSQGYVSGHGGYSASASSSGPGNGNGPYHGWSGGGSYSPYRRSSYEPTSQSSASGREDE